MNTANNYSIKGYWITLLKHVVIATSWTRTKGKKCDDQLYFRYQESKSMSSEKLIKKSELLIYGLHQHINESSLVILWPMCVFWLMSSQVDENQTTMYTRQQADWSADECFWGRTFKAQFDWCHESGGALTCVCRGKWEINVWLQ